MKTLLAAVATDNHAAPSSLAIKPRLNQKDSNEKDSMRKRPITNNALREGQGTKSKVLATYQAVADSDYVLCLPNSTGINDKLANGQPIEAGQSSGQTGSSQSDAGEYNGTWWGANCVRMAEREATTEHKLQSDSTGEPFWPLSDDEIEQHLLLLA